MRTLPHKNRLIVWLALILAAGFLLTSVIGYVTARNTVRQNIMEGLPLTGDTVYSVVQKELLRPVSISAQMAENTFLRDWVLAGEREIGPVQRYLENIQERFGANTSFFISERSRKYYHPSGVLQVVREDDPRDRWYFRVREMKAPYELNADPDEANRDTMTIFVNYRLLDGQDRFLGITGVGVTLNSLTGLLHDIEKRFARRVYFVDAQGKIVLADNTNPDLRGSIKNLPGRSSIADTILTTKAESTQTSYTQNGSTVLVNSRFIPELQWHLLVEQDEAAVVAPFTRLLLVNLGVGGLATLLVLGLTLFTVNQYQARLERLATVDALTQTINRATGETMLEQVRKDATRTSQPFSVILFDVDDFKRINDTLGHATGDRVIRGVADVVKTAVRESDTLIRWGGEEFLLVCKTCTLEQAHRLAEQLRARIGTHDFGLSQPVTISLGVAEHLAKEDTALLTARADRAMYAAKHAGKNRAETALHALTK